jgi:hypothetical protein
VVGFVNFDEMAGNHIEPGGTGIFSIVRIEFKPISAIFCVSSFANARGLSEFAQQFG